MVIAGIVLGHKISSKEIEVDRAKVEVIEKLPPPVNVRGIQIFLRHVGNLLNKNTPFNFDDNYLYAFENLKEKHISGPVIFAPYWQYNFELISDASDYVVGIGQRKESFPCDTLFE